MKRTIFIIYSLCYGSLFLLSFSLFTMTQGLTYEGIGIALFHAVSLITLYFFYKGKIKSKHVLFAFCTLYFGCQFWGTWEIAFDLPYIFVGMLVAYGSLPVLGIYFFKNNLKTLKDDSR